MRCLHQEQIFLETLSPACQRTVGLQRKRTAFKDNFVLPTHQMRVNQRQSGGQRPAAHHDLALAPFACVKGRGVDHHQQLGPGLFSQLGRLLKPGVFADQQADMKDLTVVCRHRKNAHAVARREVTSLVKHLVIGQLAFGVGVQHVAFLQHPRCIVALLHGHAFGTHAARCVIARPGVAKRGRTHHHSQAL